MSASRAKGTAFETAVVEFLRTHGFPHAERRALRGARDCGDIAGVIGHVLELKNCREMKLAEWMNEAQKEAINDGCWRFAVIHKRRGRNVREAYVTMPLWAWCEAVREDVAPIQEAAS